MFASKGNLFLGRSVKKVMKQFPTLGCCGLDCGLCPRYYTKGESRCSGCFGKDFAKKHPSCSIITCCFKDKGLEVCAKCSEFTCQKYDKETFEKDSFISHKRIRYNHNYIREYGLEKFLQQQKKRIEILEEFLEKFDEGRSKSFVCLAAALLSLESLEKAEKEIEKAGIGVDDSRASGEILKDLLNNYAREEKAELKLRK